MKKLLFLFALLASSVYAQTPGQITILLNSTPGGIYDVQSRALEKTLRTQGYDIDYVITGSCKGGEIWLKDNPTKPAIFLANTEDEIYRLNYPTSDGACNLGYTKEKMIAVALVSRQNVCSMLPADKAMEKFRKGKHILGTVFPPLNNYNLASDLVDALKLNSKVLKYQGNPILVQALISGDIDFAFFQNVMPAISAGATCFLTLGDKTYAQQMNRTSISAVDPKTKYIDYKAIQAYMGQNVDVSLMRKFAVETLKTDANIQKELEAGHRLGGVATGTSVDQQWKFALDQISKYTKK
jgi:hypothetical protein